MGAVYCQTYSSQIEIRKRKTEIKASFFFISHYFFVIVICPTNMTTNMSAIDLKLFCVMKTLGDTTILAIILSMSN